VSRRGKEGKGKAAGQCGWSYCGKHRGGWWSGEGKLREGLFWEA